MSAHDDPGSNDPSRDPRTTTEPPAPTASRVDAFARLAAQRAAGEMVLLPRMLDGQDRRRHVRQTIREDHATRIVDTLEDSRQGDTRGKFDRLVGSVFSFFRGTALLFHRDLAGEDPWMPTVLVLGDVHPGNFGVMPDADDRPVFGVNDFDEATYAPFTWDLKRGAVGFWLAAAEEGLSEKRARKTAKAFLRGYVAAMQAYAGSDEQDRQRRDRLTAETAPDLVRTLIEEALEEGRDAWLARKYHDPADAGRSCFRADDELVPLPDVVARVQAALTAWAATVDLPAERVPGLVVKDVCRRLGQGTASLGLERLYVLLAGPAADGTDDVLLELKQARRSALDGLVPPTTWTRRSAAAGEAVRISHAQAVHVVAGDRFSGALDLDLGDGTLPFVVRERSPYRASIDLDDLDAGQWKEYAEVCGRALAQAHAMSDDTGLLEHDVEPDIVAAIGPPALFTSDLLAFAEDAVARVRADHAHFVRDHDLGAFDDVDRVYR